MSKGRSPSGPRTGSWPSGVVSTTAGSGKCARRGFWPIRPGAFIEVIVPGRRYPGTFKLPETVLYDDDHVFIDVDGRLVRRDVKIVGYDEDAIILKGDLKPGDQVLVTRIAEVGEGLKVRSEGQGPVDASGVAPKGRGT